MTFETLFIVLIPTYLAIVAYGVVSRRRRGLSGMARLIAGSIAVLLVPAAILLALYATRDAFLIAGWGVVVIAMAGMGAMTACLAEFIARRTGA